MADGIKLWDLRTNRCVRRYDGHVNRSQPVGLAISPCARFIATGSEDKSVSLETSCYFFKGGFSGQEKFMTVICVKLFL